MADLTLNTLISAEFYLKLHKVANIIDEILKSPVELSSRSAKGLLYIVPDLAYLVYILS
jgi:hypothetical protein